MKPRKHQAKDADLLPSVEAVIERHNVGRGLVCK